MEASRCSWTSNEPTTDAMERLIDLLEIYGPCLTLCSLS